MTTVPLPKNPAVPPPTPVQRLSDALWIGVPLHARRFSAWLAVSTVDGLHLAVRPVVGLLSVPAALGAGAVVGAQHPGFEDIFTESLWLLVAVAFAGAVSGTIGLYFTLGFAVGDLLLGDHPLWNFSFRNDEALELAAQYGSWLLSYAVLAMLAVGVPIAAKSLAAEFSLPAKAGRAVRGTLALIAVIGITALLVFVWIQSAPLLVRPVFVWADVVPTVPAIAPLQEDGGLVVAAGALGALVRVTVLLALAGRASTAIRGGHAPAGARLLALERRFDTAEPVRPLLSRAPAPLRLAGRALVMTTLLAGLFAELWQAALTFGVLVTAQLLVTPLTNLVPVNRFLHRIPRLVRLGLAVVPALLLGTAIFEHFLRQGTTSFVPFLVVTLISAVLMMLLLPANRAEQRKVAR